MKAFTFSVPQNIMVGKGNLKKLPEVAKKLGGTHAFIISLIDTIDHNKIIIFI